MNRSSARGAFAALLCSALAITGIASLASAGLRENPADHPRLLNKPIEDARYDRAVRCLDQPSRGAKALEAWLGQHVRGTSWGIMRCERLGGDNFSLHAEGRALDWHLDARILRQRRAAMNLIRTLIGKDKNGEPTALARRMGVQGLIFNCRTWWSGQQGLGNYSYCFRPNGKKRKGLNPTQAHVDHVHIELNWPGARKRTSFWKSPLAPRQGVQVHTHNPVSP